MVKAFNEILRDFETDGVPSSGPHQPIKADFREALTAVEAFSNASGSALVYQDRATLFADLAHAANTMAWVVNDATTAYNGIYQKSGASGSGSWTRVADLPYSFIVATNSGAGTANAIQATTAIPVTSSALILLPIVATASSDPITVSFNGDPALTIKTVSGNSASALTTGMWILGNTTGSDFRMLNDQDVAALVARAETARDDAVAAAASINQRIYTSLADATADTIPASVKRLMTQFYAPNYGVPETLVGGADYKRISFADLTGYPTQSYFRSVDRFMPDGTTDETNGGYWVLDEREATVTMFGAIGNGTTDDSTAIQSGLTWWKLASDRTLIFDEGKRFLMNSGAAVDCDGISSVGSIIMHGSVKSAANVTALLTFTNIRGGRFRLKVFGGGQTADYSQADPTDKNEAFRFVNAYGSTIEYVEGHEYAGRVLRITSTTPGSGGFRSQWIDIQAIYVNSSAAISAAEETRLAQGVGQSAYIDSGTVAFGVVRSWIAMWEKYGPVIRDTTDVTVVYMESLWRGVLGFRLEGVISFHGCKLNLGSELVLFDVMRITNGTAASANIVIDELLAIGGTYGLRAENVGQTAGPGLKISSLMTRQNTRGVTLSGCSECEINLHSWNDEIAFETAGTCDNIQVHCMITASKRQAIYVSSGSNNISFSGSAYNGNTDDAASISLIDILTTNPIFFEGFIASSGNVDYIYDVPANNNTIVNGGRVTIADSSVRANVNPRRVKTVVGWATRAIGTATILNGTTSIVVDHGLVGTPDLVLVAGASTETSDCFITDRTSTQFTINVPAAVTADRGVHWEAIMNIGQ